jgi:hypothetical protein
MNRAMLGDPLSLATAGKTSGLLPPAQPFDVNHHDRCASIKYRDLLDLQRHDAKIPGTTFLLFLSYPGRFFRLDRIAFLAIDFIE